MRSSELLFSPAIQPGTRTCANPLSCRGLPGVHSRCGLHTRSVTVFRDRYPGASDISSPPCLPRLLPAGAIAGWALHPLESAALSRRTWKPDIAKSKIQSCSERGLSRTAPYANFQTVGIPAQVKRCRNRRSDGSPSVRIQSDDSGVSTEAKAGRGVDRHGGDSCV